MRHGPELNQLALLLYLRRPTFYALASAADWNILADLFHPDGAIEETVVAHATSIRSGFGKNLKHWEKEIGHLLAVLDAEVVFFMQYVWESPVSQAMDVTQFAFTIEDFLRPFT